MSLELRWSAVAERDLREIPWRVAATIDAAAMHLAATGQGEVSRVVATDPNRLRLRVRGAEARLYVDREARAIYVVRVFRR